MPTGNVPSSANTGIGSEELLVGGKISCIETRDLGLKSCTCYMGEDEISLPLS